MASLLALRLSAGIERGRPDPEIGRTSVKVQLERLARRANGDLSQVLRVVLGVLRWDVTGLPTTTWRLARLWIGRLRVGGLRVCRSTTAAARSTSVVWLLLMEHMVTRMRSAANFVSELFHDSCIALLSYVLGHEVGSIKGGGDVVCSLLVLVVIMHRDKRTLLEKIDKGLWTRRDIVGILNELDTLEVIASLMVSHDCGIDRYTVMLGEM